MQKLLIIIIGVLFVGTTLAINCKFTDNAKYNLEHAAEGRYFVGLLHLETGDVNIATSTRKLIDIVRSEDPLEISGDIVQNGINEVVHQNKLGNKEYPPILRFTANQSGATTPGHITMLLQLHDIDNGFVEDNLASLAVMPWQAREQLTPKYAGFGGLITNDTPKEVNLTWDSRSLNTKLNAGKSYILPIDYQSRIIDLFKSEGFGIFNGDVSSSHF